jgi:preprotein translocase subunit Sec61beta
MSGAVSRTQQGAAQGVSKHVATDKKLVSLTPENVMWMAIGFIVVVFMLHILGKMAS